MDSTDSYMRKTCKSCLEDITKHITCSKCEATYHIYCVKNVPGAYVDPQGQLLCCLNITSKDGSSRNILRTQDGPIEKVIVKESLDECKEDLESYQPEQVTIKEHLEDYYGECSIKSEGVIQELTIKDEDLENCLPDEEDSEQNRFKCESCYLDFTNKEHLEGHYRECPFIIQGVFIQEINRNKEFDDCLHKEEDLEQNEFKCSACLLEFINEQHLDNHYKECPNKQREFLQESYEHKAGLACSFCNEENFQHESYDQHLKRCEEYHSGLNKMNAVSITSTKRKEARLYANKHLFKCNKCGYATKRHHFLKYHILSKHNNGRKRSTHIEYTLEKHLRTHTGHKPFKCNRCDYQTVLKRLLKIHMKIKHSNPETKYKCSDCNYSTSLKSRLAIHVRVHANEMPMKCDNCNYATYRRDVLNYHILVKHSNVEKKYKCSDCKYSTHQKSQLVSHTRIHTNEKPFKCNTCSYAAASMAGLRYHILVTHSKAEKRYKCRECKYSTHQRSNLAVHTITHTNEKPFKCDKCNYATKRRYALKRHILIKHSNVEKKYKCSDCKYSTYRESHLVSHTRTHTNEKPFKCNTCSYAATSMTGLRYHILVKHSKAKKMYKCRECKYSTHKQSSLTVHTITHTNEKPIKCDNCNYATNRKDVLNRHILTKHSNAEKKHKCNDCNYSTHQKGHMVKHTKIHTKRG